MTRLTTANKANKDHRNICIGEYVYIDPWRIKGVFSLSKLCILDELSYMITPTKVKCY
jgi:hypothetical protein